MQRQQPLVHRNDSLPHVHLGLRNYLFTHSATGYEAKMCGLTIKLSRPPFGVGWSALLGGGFSSASDQLVDPLLPT